MIIVYICLFLIAEYFPHFFKKKEQD